MGATDEFSPDDRHRSKRHRRDSRSPERRQQDRPVRGSRYERKHSKERDRERSREHSRHGGSRQQEDRRGYEEDRRYGRERDRDWERDRERDRDRPSYQSSREGRDHAEENRHWGPGHRNRDERRHDDGQRQHRSRSDHNERQPRQEHPEHHKQGDPSSGKGTQREDKPGREAAGSRQQQAHQQQQGRADAGRGPLSGDKGGGKGGKQRWGKPEEWSDDEPAAPAAPKQGPNMGLSGKLAAETNKTVDGTAELKYQPPPEARVCKQPPWRLYCFKGDKEAAPTITLNQMPFYLFGKDRKVADIPTDHPSCSRQHAVLCFREIEVDAPDGLSTRRIVKPYLMDLESINGTTINKEKLEGARYYELLHMDVIRFGLSSREYVIMNEATV